MMIWRESQTVLPERSGELSANLRQIQIEKNGTLKIFKKILHQSLYASLNGAA